MLDEATRDRAREADVNARWSMMRELYKAMYGEEPPAMPISGGEAWKLLIDRIEHAAKHFCTTTGDVEIFPHFSVDETRRWY